MMAIPVAPASGYSPPEALLEARTSELQGKLAAGAERFGADPRELGNFVVDLGLTDQSFPIDYRSARDRSLYEQRERREEVRFIESASDIGTCALERAVNRFPESQRRVRNIVAPPPSRARRVVIPLRRADETVQETADRQVVNL